MRQKRTILSNVLLPLIVMAGNNNFLMLKAIIFDFDGVIANSEPTHFATFRRVMAEEGIDISQADYYQNYLAMDDRGAFTRALTQAGRQDLICVPELIKRKADYFQAHWQTEMVIYPDALAFIPTVANHYPLAINSGALRHEIELVLAQIKLRQHFSLIVSSEDVTNCKPDPEGYRLALARLNTQYPKLTAQPEECLVIEDSVGGVASAIAAGMRCVAVTNTYAAQQLTQATSVVSSLNELTEEYLISLFRD
ncbi:MAG: HAD family phosphatase [Acidobacteriota bacterium]